MKPSYRSISNPNPLPHFLANTILRKHSLPSPRICLTKSFPLTRPLSTAFCRTYIASLHAASSAQRVQSCCATIVCATNTSSIGGCCFVFAARIVLSQSWMLRCRIDSLVDMVASRASSCWISASRRWCAARRAFCWAWSGAMADRFWLTFWWACCTREVEMACSRCSLSGFGGMGGAGAGGPWADAPGSAMSNGSDRRSGGACFCG